MLLHNPAKLPPIDRFEKLPKNAIYAAHRRPLSEYRQPESIQFVLDLPGMRCGIVNHSPDSPALLGAKILSKLQPIEISEAYAKALESGRRDGKGGLSPRTVHHMPRVLFSALDQAEPWKLINRNSAALLEKRDRPMLERNPSKTFYAPPTT